MLVGSLQDPHQQDFLRGHDDFITCLAISHNGQLAASGQQGRTYYVCSRCRECILAQLSCMLSLHCIRNPPPWGFQGNVLTCLIMPRTSPL